MEITRVEWEESIPNVAALLSHESSKIQPKALWLVRVWLDKDAGTYETLAQDIYSTLGKSMIRCLKSRLGLIDNVNHS
jgi:hypothetical protein